MFRCCMVVFVVLLSGAPALSQGSLQEALLSEEKKLIEAIRQKDRATLEEMFSDEVYAVTSEGGRQTGAQMLRSLDQVTLDTYKLSDVKAVEVSRDVGILTYKYTWSGSHNGVPRPAKTVFATSTWVLRDGRWKSIFYQETPSSEQGK